MTTLTRCLLFYCILINTYSTLHTHVGIIIGLGTYQYQNGIPHSYNNYSPKFLAISIRDNGRTRVYTCTTMRITKAGRNIFNRIGMYPNLLENSKYFPVCGTCFSKSGFSPRENVNFNYEFPTAQRTIGKVQYYYRRYPAY